MMYQFDTQVLHLWDFENLSSLKPDVDSEKCGICLAERKMA